MDWRSVHDWAKWWVGGRQGEEVCLGVISLSLSLSLSVCVCVCVCGDICIGGRDRRGGPIITVYATDTADLRPSNIGKILSYLSKVPE